MIPTRHSSHRRTGKRLLAVVLLLVIGGDALFWGYVVHPMNTWPALRGLVVGDALASIAVAASLYRRHSWSRYVFIFLQGLIGAIFSAAFFFAFSKPYLIEKLPFAHLTAGLLLHAGALAILVCSRGISRLSRPSGSGG